MNKVNQVFSQCLTFIVCMLIIVILTLGRWGQ